VPGVAGSHATSAAISYPHCSFKELRMRRRQFITGLAGATMAWPLAARAQQGPMPVIGYLNLGSPAQSVDAVAAFRKGLGETGYVIGQNVKIEFRWAEDASQIPALAADLVRLKPVVISVNSSAGVLATKAATTAIPIVFGIGDDPVRLGLVASLNHPGGNLTGTTTLNIELEGKRLAVMNEIVPAEKTIAALVDKNNPAAESQANSIEAAARRIGRKVRVLWAANERDIDDAFRGIVQENLGALFVAAGLYFGTRRIQIVTLATNNAIPAFYSRREFAEAGGLASYGTDLNESFRQQGIYVGRILAGERPADLPVVQTAKFEFVINLKTATALGLTIPETLLATADEVIQ
jgi:putative tryptophan/tyrosine transport system substrate-binding protein